MLHQRCVAMFLSRKLSSTHFLRKFSSSGPSTLREEEIIKFRKLAAEWWDSKGPFQALHSLNKLRIPFVRNGILSYQPHAVTQSFPVPPLSGYRILDVGCGGGILSESLARLGAQVTGIDPCQESITAASLRASNSKMTNLTYEVTTVEELALTSPTQFDAITASEVIEHLDSQEYFIQMCTSLLKPGGSLFITTLNKNFLSWALGIIAAEYVLNLVAKGTHDWDKFISPSDLLSMTENSGCQLRQIQGMSYNPITNKWFWTKDTSVNYALHVTKIPEPTDAQPPATRESNQTN